MASNSNGSGKDVSKPSGDSDNNNNNNKRSRRGDGYDVKAYREFYGVSPPHEGLTLVVYQTLESPRTRVYAIPFHELSLSDDDLLRRCANDEVDKLDVGNLAPEWDMLDALMTRLEKYEFRMSMRMRDATRIKMVYQINDSQ